MKDISRSFVFGQKRDLQSYHNKLYFDYILNVY